MYILILTILCFPVLAQNYFYEVGLMLDNLSPEQKALAGDFRVEVTLSGNKGNISQDNFWGTVATVVDNSVRDEAAIMNLVQPGTRLRIL